jgi:uncharacterized protein (TIGR03663 family)
LVFRIMSMTQLKALRRIESRWSASDTLICAVIFLLALVFRLWDLEIKPPHFDEGINGHFVMRMWKEGFFTYDPSNFHGPLYFYFLQLSEIFFGRGIFAFRFITALISVAIVIVVALHRRFFGGAAYWAALIIALSPGFVFYGRYAIHESLFVLLQVVFSYGFFLWREEKSRLSAVLMITGFFGTFAVKETFFIFFGTWAIAIVCMRLADKWFPFRRGPFEFSSGNHPSQLESSIHSEFWGGSRSQRAMTSDLALMLILAVLVTCIFFSGFFMNLKGVPDMFRAFAFWTKTGTGGSGHEKPFFYWIRLLWIYEWPILLGLVVSPLVFFKSARRERIMILVGFGTWLAYSLIPYKTPWLALNFYWPLALVSGISLHAMTRMNDGAIAGWLRFHVSILAILIVGLSTREMVRLNFRDFTKPSEPYVYVQTTTEFKAVMDVISAHLIRRPEDLTMKVLSYNKDPWPLPWVLSEFPNLHYGNPRDGDLLNAGVILIDATDRGVLEARLMQLGQGYWVMPFQIRDSYGNGWAFLSFEKFKGVVPSATEIFTPASSGSFDDGGEQ